MSTCIIRSELAPPQIAESQGQNDVLSNALAGQPPAPNVPQIPRLAFSVRETAAILGISEKSVRRLIARGLLRPSKALRHILIPKVEIERFLRQT